MAPRQQINVLRRTAPRRPRFGQYRSVGLRRLLPVVPQCSRCVEDRPARDCDPVAPCRFRAYWRWKSRRRGGRPTVSGEIRRLIRAMSLANPLWSAPRIHGELLSLASTSGRRARRSIWRGAGDRHLRAGGHFFATMPMASPRWTVPTISFRLLYGLLILRHDRRRILWMGVMAHPTAEWIARQVVEACGWEPVPSCILRDRDQAYGKAFTRRICAMGIRDRPRELRDRHGKMPMRNG